MLTVFAHGTLLGPAQVAAHRRGKVSVHELTLAENKHATAGKIEKASATVINAFSKLDVAVIPPRRLRSAGLRPPGPGGRGPPDVRPDRRARSGCLWCATGR